MEKYQRKDMSIHEAYVLSFYRSLVPGGVAQQDGRLIPGDRLMYVNEVKYTLNWIFFPLRNGSVTTYIHVQHSASIYARI